MGTITQKYYMNNFYQYNYGNKYKSGIYKQLLLNTL